jgi:hypothetical protein
MRDTAIRSWLARLGELGDTARKYWPAAVIAVAALIILSTLATTAPPAPPAPPVDAAGARTYEIRGFLALTGPDGVLVSRTDTIADDPVCWGQSQYQDISLGVTVTVFDDRDRIVAEGALEQGRAPTQTIPADGSCFFPIVVHDVPAGSAFYQVEVARRGTVLLQNTPESGVLYAFVSLDDDLGALPKVADQRPRLPVVVN